MNLMRRFPCIVIPETLVVRNSLADASLWILHLIGSFGSNLSRHLFEWFGFGESDGLDNVEMQIEGSSKCFALLISWGGHGYLGTICFYVNSQLWVTFARFFRLSVRFALSVRTSTTSTTKKYYHSFSSSHKILPKRSEG